jgi:regulator of protease activity HflC (stomatin/prohibitin superfamily)
VTREFQKNAVSGSLALLLLLAATALLAALFIRTVASGEAERMPLIVLAFPLLVLMWRGLFIVQPNQGKALQLFGRYAGTVRSQGLWWANPFYTKRAISLRVRNFETAKLKVNDHNSNPIEIAAVVVWQVTDTAEALFEVDNYEDYVKVQSESALRGLANQYPYDSHVEGTLALSTTTQQVAEKLQGEIQERLAKAGVKVVHLDEERKAAMVSNLLVVLCSEQGTQPVVNTGSIY